MRKGSESELVSNFTRAQFQDLKFKPGIAPAANGQPLASLEVVTVINLASVDDPEGNNVTVRGLLPVGHRDAARTEDRRAGAGSSTGKREVVVGKPIARALSEARAGQEAALRPRRLGYRGRDGRRATARRTAKSGAI